MVWTVASQFNVKKLSTLNLFVLRLTSTRQFVRSRWKVVSGQSVQIPSTCNVLILVGGHFDHQPDNCNALLCESSCYRFDNHHTPVTAKGGCLWQQNNGNAKIRTPWWNISLMATLVCAESSVNTAARSSTPRPETVNIAVFKPAATRCSTYAKASESASSAERIPAPAAVNSSYRFGQMPDIAAMPVGRKTTTDGKRIAYE